MPEPPTPTLIPTDAEAEDRSSRNGAPPPASPRKPKLKKLRLAFVVLGLGALAVISTVFGMLMAVSSDLPALESQAEYDRARNSLLFFDDPDDPACRDLEEGSSCELAKLTGNQNRVLLEEGEISPLIKNAVIAIEDRRFYQHEGVDYKGIARAFWQDVLRRRAAQGGSTITQQFVKNALSAQGNRSVFQKLRESALAYHLERKWSKEKILTQYLNSVYFGSGAYGVESAVRTYFGDGDDEDDELTLGTEPVEEPDTTAAASSVTPAQAALLAGVIASPSMYDPVQSPVRATERRNVVLQRMREQGMISQPEYEQALKATVPDEQEVDPPRPDSEQPYFSSWVTQQLVERYRPGVVFGGGLRIKTTIDPELQASAEQAIANRVGAIGPSASLVAIENGTGEIKAMVGGSDFDALPFNLAVNGHRQPGSAFKPFILVRALADGVSPEATFASQQKVLRVKGYEPFEVNNYEDTYFGLASLRAATAASDNSVYAELGVDVGTKRVARMARRMGIRTPISTNPAMTLGGLEQGVTPLEMAYAYSTIANKGMKVSGSLAPDGRGPVAIESVKGAGIDEHNEPRKRRVFPEPVGETAQLLLSGVIANGTGKAAEIGEFAFGKTGTTENYGDAWFVGANEQLTVAVWVGYADRLQPMETEYLGGPVAGGTFPAEIWHDFMASWIDIRERRDAASGDDDEDSAPVIPYEEPLELPPAEQAAPTTTEEPAAPAPEPEAPEPAQPQEPAPEPEPPPAPTPPPTPTPPEGGDGGGVSPNTG